MRNKNIADLTITGQIADPKNYGGIIQTNDTPERQRMPNWTRFLNETIARLKAEKAVSRSDTPLNKPTKGR